MDPRATHISHDEKLPADLACLDSGRALFAELSFDGRSFVAASFHATPGRGKDRAPPSQQIHEFKPFFHGAVAVALSHVNQPFIFGIDANEPRTETSDSVTFHWKDGRTGNKRLAALLGLEPMHPARDLLRESMTATATPPANDEYLEKTHELKKRRSAL